MQIHQVRKVRRQRQPGYPTRPEVTRDPELLRRHVPSAWKKSAQVTAALSIMLASAQAQDAPSRAKVLKIAPVFEHGEGQGSTGCIAVTSPQFLPEDEAMRIITEELAKAGIPSPERDKSLPNVLIAEYGLGTFMKYLSKYDTTAPATGMVEKKRGPWTFDLYEPTKRIAIEYVSLKDENIFRAINKDWLGGSVTPRDFVKAAKWVRDELWKNTDAPDMYYGIFYDPCPRQQEPDWNKAPSDPGERLKWLQETKARNKSPQGCLRAQVRDYVEWLKFQGALDDAPPAQPVTAVQSHVDMEKFRAQVKNLFEWLKAQGAI